MSVYIDMFRCLFGMIVYASLVFVLLFVPVSILNHLWRDIWEDDS